MNVPLARPSIRELIAAKRDGKRHSASDLSALARYAANPAECGVQDYQLSAWLMAAYLKGLDRDETAALTQAMATSGERLDLTGLPHPWVDKHSSGGVGDKTTISLLPILAACGLTVVKMSGRGLGITGGTVDKLASIPGFRLDLSPAEMVAQARRIGVALTGQTPQLAPADKTLYALRDTTETVESIPLIVSSILSKKLAGGAEILGLDIKCGSGAFMPNLERATELSEWLHDIAQRCGLRCHIAITDMDQPLGRAAGNALEVREAWEIFEPGSVRTRFTDLVEYLAAETLVATDRAANLEAARTIVSEALSSGRARSKAQAWIEAQGGTFNPAALPKASTVRDVTSRSGGWVKRVDARTVGEVVIRLGGGRMRKEDSIDPAVGVETFTNVGGRIEKGELVFRIHAASEASAQSQADALERALEVQNEPIAPTPIVLKTLK